MVIIWLIIMTGWWCNVPILKHDGVKVNRKDNIPYMKWNMKLMFQTTKQMVMLFFGYSFLWNGRFHSSKVGQVGRPSILPWQVGGFPRSSPSFQWPWQHASPCFAAHERGEILTELLIWNLEDLEELFPSGDFMVISWDVMGFTLR